MTVGGTRVPDGGANRAIQRVWRQRRCLGPMEKLHSVPEALRYAILSGLDLLPIAFFVLDQRGKILVANQAAKDVTQHGGIMRVADNVLSVDDGQHNKVFRELIGKARDGETRIPAGLTVPRPDGKPLSILVVPIENTGTAGSGHPASLVFLSDPELPNEPDTALLTRLFGFTPAEAKVASLLMQGLTVGDVAERLSITSHTTRNHLKRLFSKTNTKKQGELVHTLLSSPAFLRIAVRW